MDFTQYFMIPETYHFKTRRFEKYAFYPLSLALSRWERGRTD
jgi:hypothetical protein